MIRAAIQRFLAEALLQEGASNWAEEWRNDYPRPEWDAHQTLTGWASMRALSYVQGTLPVHMYERKFENGKPSGQRERVYDHPLAMLFSGDPQPGVNCAVYRTRETMDLNRYGEHLAYLYLGPRGFADAMERLEPVDVEILKGRERNGRPAPLYKVNGRARPWRRMIHIRSTTMGLYRGTAAQGQAKVGMELGAAIERHQLEYFLGGAQAAFYATVPDNIKGRNRRRLLARMIRRALMGPRNAHGIGILEYGTELKKLSHSPEEAGISELQQSVKSGMAAAEGQPSHTVGELTHATYTNIEQQSLDWVIQTIAPLCIYKEKEWNSKLLPTPELRRRYFFEHSVDGLLRGDSASRASFYLAAIQGGWMKPHEIRQRENLPYDADFDNMPALSMAAQAGFTIEDITAAFTMALEEVLLKGLEAPVNGSAPALADGLGDALDRERHTNGLGVHG